MATEPVKPPPSTAASPRRGTVVAPDDLVQLVGEQRLRQIHARWAAKLRGLARGGTLSTELQVGLAGAVVDVEFTTRERLQ